jgi:protoporphyrinogen oxidase
MAAGHRLRDATAERGSRAAQSAEVVIVGAGVSGLSAAWRLERLGQRRYVVLDLEATVGGTAAWGSDGVVPYPWGAHYLPLPAADNRGLLTLLREMGTVQTGRDGAVWAAERQLVRAPEERVFYQDRWHEGLFPRGLAAAADLEELGRFRQQVQRWVGWRDGHGRRAFTLPARRCSSDAEVTKLDRICAADWLEQHDYRSPLLRWYIEHACRDDYATTLEETSAWAMLFYFCARVPTPGAPSAPFLTWPEGNGHLVRYLGRIAGARVQTGQLVTDVVPGPEQVSVTAMDARTRALTRLVAPRVILAVPQFVAAKVLRPWRDQAPAHLSAFSYSPWLVANLHLRQRPRSRGFQLAWDNVIYDSPALGYVVATHQQLSDYGPTIWTYYRPFTGADPCLARQQFAQLGHAELCDAVLSDLGRAHQGLERAVDRIDVWRWGHAMVRPTPDLIWGTARQRAAEPWGRVHFAHSDLSGLALFEEAFDWGVRAAEAVVQAEGRPVQPL